MRLGLLTLLRILVCAPLATAQTGGSVVAKSDLHIRSNPSSSSRALSSVPKGYPVIMGSCRRGWCEVGYMGVRGYVPENRLVRAQRPVTSGARRVSPRAIPSASQEAERAVLPAPSGPVRPLCKGKYDEAEAQFAVGAYTETVALLSVCAGDATFTWAEAASAFRMLALSNFYEGDQRAARSALVELLDREPDYEPAYALDPPTYVTLVRNLKLELQLISSADYQCDEHVVDAQAQYVAANYDGVLNLLHGCLNEPGLSAPVALRTHRLAALTHMKRDDMDAAHATIQALLVNVPDYRADAVQDVPAYVALVDLVREKQEDQRSPWGW